jgi:hypothetical protein
VTHPRFVAALAALAAPALPGCPEWLEVDPDAGSDVATPADPDGALSFLPLDLAPALPVPPPRADGRGPLVPATPGLRVPDGTWLRARLDVADLWMPYAWLAAAEAGPRLVLRLHATGGPETAGRSPFPLLRAVLSLAVPEGTTLEAMSGLALGAEALDGSIVGLETAGDHHWLVRPTRLLLEEVTPRAVKGLLEGEARRGTKSPKTRSFQAGFVALRAPRTGP